MPNSQKKGQSKDSKNLTSAPANLGGKKIKSLNKEAIKLLKKKPTLLIENTGEFNTTKSSISNNAKTSNSLLAKTQANLLSQYVFNKFFICCKESRIENANSFYGCFYIGPFDESLSQTLAHNIRRTLLSQLSGLAITAVEIDGALHKFSNLPGIKETVLDLLCNLQNLVFKKTVNGSFAKSLAKNSVFEKMEVIAYLRVRGPGVITAADIILPAGIQCVNPKQYIGTLAEDGVLNIKLFINEGKNSIKQKQKNFDLTEIKEQYLVNKLTGNLSNSTQSNLNNESAVKNQNVNESSQLHSVDEFNSIDTLADSTFDTSYLLNNNRTNKIYLDSVFMPVKKVNTIVQTNDKCTDDLLENHLKYKFLPNTPESSLTEFNSLDKQNNQQFIEASAFTKAANLKTHYNLSQFNISNSDIDTNTVQKNKKLPTFFTIQNSDSNVANKVTSFLDSEQNFNSPSENKNIDLTPNPELKEQIIVLTQKNKLISEINTSLNVKKQCHIVVEIWTNGSIHPREALKNCLQFLTNTFITLDNVKMLGSMYKSDITYAKVLKQN